MTRSYAHTQSPIVFDNSGDRLSAAHVLQFNLSATSASDAVGNWALIANLPPPDFPLQWRVTPDQLDFGTPDNHPPPDRPPPSLHSNIDPVVLRNIAIACALVFLLLVVGGVLALRRYVKRTIRNAELARLRWRVPSSELALFDDDNDDDDDDDGGNRGRSNTMTSRSSDALVAARGLPFDVGRRATLDDVLAAADSGQAARRRAGELVHLVQLQLVPTDKQVRG